MTDTIPNPSPNRSAGGNSFLLRKIGPLPLIAYPLIGVAGYVGYRWWTNRQATNQAATTVDTTSTTASPVDTSPTSMTDPSVGLVPSSGPLTTQQTNGSLVSTNAQWSNTVTNALIADGTGSATDVTNAVANYIGGVALTPVQEAIISIAITRYGVPPEGIIAVKSTAKTPTYYTTVSGDTLESVAKHFYGQTKSYVVLHQYNPGTPKSGTAKLTPGTTLLIFKG